MLNTINPNHEAIHAKLRFLATIIGTMPLLMDKGILDGDDEDFWAINIMLNDICNELCPKLRQGVSHE